MNPNPIIVSYREHRAQNILISYISVDHIQEQRATTLATKDQLTSILGDEHSILEL